MTEREAEVLAAYSTPGLRKNQFTRDGKKDWLAMSYPKMDREERDKILNELFGPEQQ
jgi:hypothetical protein